MKTFRIASGLFAACVLTLVLLVAGAGFAQAQSVDNDPQAVVKGPSKVAPLQASAVKYPIWVGKKQVTSKNAKNILGNGTASYNAKTNTLTLKNAKIKSAYTLKNGTAKYFIGIFARNDKGLTIVLKGKSTVSVPGKANAGSYGIFSSGTARGTSSNITIKGSGSLKVKAGKAGLFNYGIMCQNLNIRGSAKLTACGGTRIATSLKAGDSSQVGSFGIYNYGILALGDSAKLTAIGKKRALRTTVTYGGDYIPLVKAGASSKSLKVNKKKPASSVYTKYKYVSISKAKSSSASKKPATLTVTSVSVSGTSLKLQWNALSKNCTGYELNLSKSNSFTGDNTWKYSTPNPSMNTATLDSLTPGAQYYVRIRGVNTVGSSTYYGAWSATKSAQIAG